jgi:parallel beta-helix repeat protein
VSTDPEFAGFLSYVRTDDDDGGITALCEALEREVRLQLGRPFQIFRDVEDVRWGQRWTRRIDDTLDNASVLIPVITPTFFTRPECRREVERFLEREKQLGRDELIFAIHFVVTRPADDPLVQELFARQMAEWHPLRLEPLTDTAVRKRLAELASRIREVFAAASPLPQRATLPAQSTSIESRPPSLPANEPPTIVVDPLGRLGPTTIQAAIEASEPGMRILVHPGLYTDPLIIEQPLEIIGQGPREEIVIRVTQGDALRFRTSFGRVSNLTFHRAGKDEAAEGAVHIAQGRLELVACDLRSDVGACLYVGGGADPRVRGNSIHDAGEGGILVFGRALGTFEDNDVFRTRLAVLEASDGSNPTVRRNRLHDSREGSCIFVNEDATGTYEDNELSGGETFGFVSSENSRPTVRGNRMIGNRYGGIDVSTGGGGVYEDNVIDGPNPWDVDADCADNVIARGNTPEWTKS